jgi:hypothetical protein
MVSFAPQPLYLRRLSEDQNRCGRCGREKIFCPCSEPKLIFMLETALITRQRIRVLLKEISC